MAFRILVIEDNPDNLELMTYLLEAFGHTPLTAQDGIEGLEVARREVPDLIICDIQLPRMNGYAVAQALKEDRALAGIPRVAITALAMVGDRDKVLAAGFDCYIAKPIAPETFVAQLEKLLPGEPHSVAAPAAPSVLPPAPPRAAAKGVRILVVDNLPVNIQLARSILEPFGYQVAAASSSSSALAAARETRPDLILSDVHMPGGSGFDLIAAVKNDPMLEGIPFIFFSASFVSDQLREECLALGAARFIGRPVEPRELVSQIEDLLNERKFGPGTSES